MSSITIGGKKSTGLHLASFNTAETSQDGMLETFDRPAISLSDSGGVKFSWSRGISLSVPLPPHINRYYEWTINDGVYLRSWISELVMANSDCTTTKPRRRNILSHISLGVRSYEISKRFYTALLTPLGVELVYDNPDQKILGYGLAADHEEVLNIFERGQDAHPPGPGTHIAFNAPSRDCVRQFWEAGVCNGGNDDGPPGVRDAYGRNYFAAFLFDPDGFKLEAIFQEEEEEEEEGLSAPGL